MVSLYFGQLETVIIHYSRNNEGYLCYLFINFNNRVWGSWTQYNMYWNHILSNFESFKVLSKITIQLSSYILLVFFLYLQWLIKGHSFALLSADSISFVLGFHDRNWHWRYVHGGRNCRPPITLIIL